METMWCVVVQDMEGIREVGLFSSYEAPLENVRGTGAACAWALREDRPIPCIQPRKPGEERPRHPSRTDTSKDA